MVALAILEGHHRGHPAPAQPEQEVDVVGQRAMHRVNPIGNGRKGGAAAIALAADRNQIPELLGSDLVVQPAMGGLVAHDQPRLQDHASLCREMLQLLGLVPTGGQGLFHEDMAPPGQGRPRLRAVLPIRCGQDDGIEADVLNKGLGITVANRHAIAIGHLS